MMNLGSIQPLSPALCVEAIPLGQPVLEGTRPALSDGSAGSVVCVEPGSSPLGMVLNALAFGPVVHPRPSVGKIVQHAPSQDPQSAGRFEAEKPYPGAIVERYVRTHVELGEL